jgi:cupin fold WbuC family metalloprotein
MTLSKAESIITRKARKTAENVFHCNDKTEQIGTDEIQALKELAYELRATTRICLHPETQDILQASLICTLKELPNRKHIHPSKHEYIIAIEGRSNVVLYDENLNIRLVLESDARMASAIKIPMAVAHNFELQTDCFVFWEISQGPFNANSTIYID